MVLGSHVALDSLAIGGSSLVYVSSSRVSTDKGDCSDVRMITDEVDGVMLTVDDIDDTIWHTRLLEKLQQRHAGRGVPLTGLHDVGVAADGGHGEHPQRDHGREVEGRDAGTDSKGRPEGGQVHVL